MSANKLTYAQLLETNSMIQQNADETYWLCAMRTVWCCRVRVPCPIACASCESRV